MRFRKTNPKKDIPRIVVCAHEAPQAGDLEALLFTDFHVERAYTIGDLEKAVRNPVQAVIVFLDKAQNFQSRTPQFVHHLQKWHSRVLIIGMGESPEWVKDLNQVSFFEDVPDCRVILESLAGLNPFKGETT